MVKHRRIDDSATQGLAISLCGTPITWGDVALEDGETCPLCAALEAAWLLGGFDASPCPACVAAVEGRLLWPAQVPGDCQACEGRRWVMKPPDAPLERAPIRADVQVRAW